MPSHKKDKKEARVEAIRRRLGKSNNPKDMPKGKSNDKSNRMGGY